MCGEFNTTMPRLLPSVFGSIRPTIATKTHTFDYCLIVKCTDPSIASTSRPHRQSAAVAASKLRTKTPEKPRVCPELVLQLDARDVTEPVNVHAAKSLTFDHGGLARLQERARHSLTNPRLLLGSRAPRCPLPRDTREASKYVLAFGNPGLRSLGVGHYKILPSCGALDACVACAPGKVQQMCCGIARTLQQKKASFQGSGRDACRFGAISWMWYRFFVMYLKI